MDNLDLPHLRALHAAATKVRRTQEAWQYFDEELAFHKAMFDAFPALADRLEQLEAYRESSEAAMRTMLESGDEARGEVRQLRQRLEAAERERDEWRADNAYLAWAWNAVQSTTASEAAEKSKLFKAANICLNNVAWLAARDASMKALGAVSVFDQLWKRRGLDLPVQWQGWVEAEAARLRREAGE